MPLPSAGHNSRVQLLINPGPGVPIPATGTSVLDMAIQNFDVNTETTVITTNHLGTLDPDEDMIPRGFSGSLVASLRDGRLQAAYDLYLQAKRDNLPFEFLITHTIEFRGVNEPPRTVTYTKVELSMGESYDPQRASTCTVNWRSPRRI